MPDRSVLIVISLGVLLIFAQTPNTALAGPDGSRDYCYLRGK